MVGNVRLTFGWVSFKVKLVLFWSGIWYGKLIFLKLVFRENFIYLKNVIWIYTGFFKMFWDSNKIRENRVPTRYIIFPLKKTNIYIQLNSDVTTTRCQWRG